MNEELVGGIRAALEHGASLEQAIQGFINAGYKAQDVQEAAQALGGISAHVSAQPLLTAQPLPSKPQPSPSQPVKNISLLTSSVTPPTSAQPLPQKKPVWRYVLIGLSILIILLIASLIGVISFGDIILKWLTS